MVYEELMKQRGWVRPTTPNPCVLGDVVCNRDDAAMDELRTKTGKVLTDDEIRSWADEAEIRDGHECSGFPTNLPDVGTNGITGDGARGPWDHKCPECGESYRWRESMGFVFWVPLGEGE